MPKSLFYFFLTSFLFSGKKRPTWDYKGRLEDMEGLMAKSKSFMENMTKTIGDNQDRIGFLESLNKQLEGTVQVKHQQTEEVRSFVSFPPSGFPYFFLCLLPFIRPWLSYLLALPLNSCLLVCFVIFHPFVIILVSFPAFSFLLANAWFLAFLFPISLLRCHLVKPFLHTCILIFSLALNTFLFTHLF